MPAGSGADASAAIQSPQGAQVWNLMHAESYEHAVLPGASDKSRYARTNMSAIPCVSMDAHSNVSALQTSWCAHAHVLHRRPKLVALPAAEIAPRSARTTDDVEAGAAADKAARTIDVSYTHACAICQSCDLL